MALRITWLLLLLLSLGDGLVVKLPDESTLKFYHVTARFSKWLGRFQVEAPLAVSLPDTACSELSASALTGKIVLARRGECSFATKVTQIQRAGGAGVVVANYDDTLIQMVESNEFKQSDLFIPAVFIGASAYGDIIDLLEANSNNSAEGKVLAVLDAQGEINWDEIEKQVSSLRMMTFFVMSFSAMGLMVLIVKLVSKYMQRRRMAHERRIRMVHIPELSYSSSFHQDKDSPNYFHNSGCPICMEDFVDGDSVKRLPCLHGFHTACIDPWLADRSDLCPICKQSILSADASREVQVYRWWNPVHRLSRNYQRVRPEGAEYQIRV